MRSIRRAVGAGVALLASVFGLSASQSASESGGVRGESIVVIDKQVQGDSTEQSKQLLPRTGEVEVRLPYLDTLEPVRELGGMMMRPKKDSDTNVNSEETVLTPDHPTCPAEPTSATVGEPTEELPDIR